MFDFVIKNGLIVDGSGEKPYRASLGITANKISAVSAGSLDGTNCIDASGMIVAPGFIDLHSHSDCIFLVDNRSEGKVFQGVTTEFIGNCGISLFPNTPPTLPYLKEYAATVLTGSQHLDSLPADLREYGSTVNDKRPAINCAALIGHGTLRISALGFADRDPTQAELSAMQELLAKELTAGAWGMSLGLIYPPGSFSKTRELVELAKVLVKYDAVLCAHIRGESDRIFAAVEELLNIAYQTGVHIHISHLKLMGTAQWGQAPALLARIKKARAEGLKVSCDQYPYEASFTGLSALLPPWAHEGGITAMLAKLQGAKRAEILPLVAEEMAKRGGPGRVIISNVSKTNPSWEGKSIAEISSWTNLSPAETVVRILLDTAGYARAIYYSMDQGDIFTIMRDLNIAVASDGIALDYDNQFTEGKPHPRNFGTFPRFLRLVRENDLLPIEKAVYKMTGLPAQLIGLTDRGIIQKGNIADIVIFDPAKISDRATFASPFQKPAGIEYVLVSGRPVVHKNKQQADKPGEFLLKNSGRVVTT
ncbi:MAG: N-acyl-D-amino-acid deacylase family protein [Peptococcaceae bacterium]